MQANRLLDAAICLYAVAVLLAQALLPTSIGASWRLP